MEHNLIRILAVGAASAFGIGVAAGPVHADPEPTFIVGTIRNDWLVGTRHNDVILARPGNDFLFGRRGDDILRGNRGNDVIRAWGPLGHSGRDILGGGADATSASATPVTCSSTARSSASALADQV